MICTSNKLPNGKPSILADTLNTVFGNDVGKLIYSKTKSTMFKNKMAGSSFVDKNGEAIPLFYADKHNLSTTELNNKVVHETSIHFLSDDYTMVMQNKIKPDVVFLNENDVSHFKGKVIPNLDYLISHSKGSFNRQNTININNGNEIIVFNTNKIITSDTISDKYEVNPIEDKMYSIIDDFYDNTTNVTEVKYLNDKLNIQGFNLNSTSDTENRFELTHNVLGTMINLNLNKYNKDKIFSDKYQVLYDIMMNRHSGILLNVTDVLFRNSKIAKRASVRWDTTDSYMLRAELIASIMGAFEYIQNNNNETSNKLKSILVEDGIYTMLENGMYKSLFDILYELMPSNLETKERTNSTNNLIHTFSNYTDMLLLNDILNNENQETIDATEVNWSNALLEALKHQREQQLKQLNKLKHDNNFNEENPDDIETRKLLLKQLDRDINDLEYGIKKRALLEALTSNSIIDIHNLKLIEKLLNEVKYVDVTKISLKEGFIFQQKVNTVRLTLASILDISNIDELRNNIISDEGLTQTEINDINNQINNIKDRKYRIDNAFKELTIQEEKARVIVLSEDSNIEASTVASSILRDIKDINIIQYKFDSLMDVDNVLAAMYKKRESMYEFQAKKEVERRIYQETKKLKELLGNLYDNESERIAFMKSITVNGKLISTRNESLQDELLAKLESLNASKLKANIIKDYKEYNSDKLEFDKWYNERFRTAYTKEYYDILYSLPDDLQIEVNEINDAINEIKGEIKNINNGVYNPDLLSEIQKGSLIDLFEKRKTLIKDNPEIKEYYENKSKIYSSATSLEYSNKYNEILNTKGIDAANAWYLRNGDMSDEFNARFKQHIDTIKKSSGKSGVIRAAANKELNKIYKDRNAIDIDGLIDINKLTDADLDIIKKLTAIKRTNNLGDEQFKGIKADRYTLPVLLAIYRDYSASFNYATTDFKEIIKNVINPNKKDLFRSLDWLSTNMKDVPTDYYLTTLDLMLHNMKMGVITKEIYDDWYNKVHIDNKPIDLFIKSIPANIDINSNNVKGKSFYNIDSKINDKYLAKYNDKLFDYTQDKDVELEEYENEIYHNLSNNKKDVISYLSNTLTDLMSHYRETIYDKGNIPSVRNTDVITKEEKDKFIHKVAKDVTGEDTFDIPLNELYLLNQKEYIQYGRNKAQGEPTEQYINFIQKYILKEHEIDLTDDINTAKEEYNNLDGTVPLDEYTLSKLQTKINNLNTQIRKDNITAHNEALDLDIVKTLPIFINNAITHKYKYEIEAELTLGLSMFKNAKYRESTSGFKDKLNIYATKLSKYGKNKAQEDDKDLASDAKTSNLYNRFKKDLEMIFYDKFLEHGKYNNGLSIIKNYISMVGIGFNVTSALKNVGYGGIMMGQEAHSGIHFNKTNLTAASSQYIKLIPELISDAIGEDLTVRNKALGALLYFNIIDSQSELDIKDKLKSKDESDIKKVKNYLTDKFTFLAYAMQSGGEAYMQNSSLLAMMKSHRVVDGKVISFSEFAAAKLYKYDINELRTADEAKLNQIRTKLSKRVEDTKALKEEFNKYTTLEDAGYINAETNQWAAKEVDERELASFRIKVQGVNHSIHGIYNKSDKGAIENTMGGQFLMQYRHWIRPGWVRRYGSRGIFKSNRFYNVRRRTYDEGSWKVLGRFLSSPFKEDSLNYFLDDRDKTMLNQAKAILTGYGDMIKKAKLYYNVLSDEEKASVRSATAEVLSIVAVLILISLTKLGDDDDKRKHNKFYASMLYTLDGILTETQGFLPIYSWIGQTKQILTNPVAVFSQAEKVLSLAGNVMAYGFRGEDERVYRGGAYRGQDKVSVKLKQIIPLYNQMFRLYNMDNTQSYYSSQFFSF